MFDNLDYFVTTLLNGAVATVIATVGGSALAAVCAFVSGLMGVSRSTAVRTVSRIYVEFFRGTSELVQLYWVYFALPLLIGFKLVPLWAGVLVLGLNLGAYGSEVVRGAVLSVPQGQYEAAVALNLPRAQRMRRVILPQAIVGMLPPFNNLLIQLLKATAIISLVQVHEMTFFAYQLVHNYGQSALIFGILLIFYFILAYLITLGMRLLERRANASIGKPQPPLFQTSKAARLRTEGAA